MNEIIIGTSNYNSIHKLCNEARINSKLFVIIGYPGAGKTTALEVFCENNENAYYMRVGSSMGAKHFYAKLLNILGVEGRDAGSSLHDLINQVSFKLNYDSTKKLIVIDEAGKFKPKFLEYLHELRDNTIKNTGIILAGPEYFHDRMKIWRNKGLVGIPEFYRRINHWEYLSPPTKAEKRAMCEVYQVESDEDIQEIILTCESFSEIKDAIDSYHIMKQNNAQKTTVKKQV
jgi:hypothetical protein